jgi:uncharacterized repeat protein (TIGR03803 family)
MKILGATILLASFTLIASAQNYAVLKTFGPEALNPTIGSYTNGDGAYPTAELIISGHTLFGACSVGGPGGSGTIFKMNFDGSGFTTLHAFAAGTTNLSGTFTNSDGQQPRSTLSLSGDTLFGTTEYGGTLGGGTLFRINTNGGAFTLLKTFTPTNSSGAWPVGGVVVLGGDAIYGTTSGGGSNIAGVIFKVGTNGSNFSVIHQFAFTATNAGQPFGTLLSSGATLYGTSYSGGASGGGTVFKINTNGTGFTLLKSFSALVSGTNADGARPEARLVLAGPTLYGSTYYGGISNGVIFRVDTNGNNFTNIHTFSATTGFYNSDGASPSSGLVLAGALYGTTQFGSDAGGVIFSVNTDGSNFLPLRAFGASDPVNDGRVPAAGLALSGATLFGTSEFGGLNNSGTVFRYQWDNTPPVYIARSGTNVLVNWPTDNYPTNNFNFTLESTPQVGASATWNAVSQNTVIVNGQNTVTNAAVGTQFYRLSPF